MEKRFPSSPKVFKAGEKTLMRVPICIAEAVKLLIDREVERKKAGNVIERQAKPKSRRPVVFSKDETAIMDVPISIVDEVNSLIDRVVSQKLQDLKADFDRKNLQGEP